MPNLNIMPFLEGALRRNDGRISIQDINNSLPRNNDDARNALQRFARIDNFIKADKNGDGFLSREEIQNVGRLTGKAELTLRDIRALERQPLRQMNILNDLRNLLQRNNRNITQQDLEGLANSYMTRAGQARTFGTHDLNVAAWINTLTSREIFNIADVDNNGAVTYSELFASQQAIRNSVGESAAQGLHPLLPPQNPMAQSVLTRFVPFGLSYNVDNINFITTRIRDYAAGFEQGEKTFTNTASLIRVFVSNFAQADILDANGRRGSDNTLSAREIGALSLLGDEDHSNISTSDIQALIPSQR